MTTGLRCAVGALLLTAGLAMAGEPVSAQGGPDRSKPPVPGPAPGLRLPPIQKQTLSNGLPVWIVEMHEVPMVDVSLIIRSGAAADPAGQFGVAHFTAAMLDEGAGSLDALALADAIDMLGASLTTASSYDASTVRLHALVSTLDTALPLMADVALRPTFPAEAIDRVRSERLTSLLQVRDSPFQLVTAAFHRLLFGDAHRYGTPVMGTDSVNRALSADDMRAFHASHYQPQNAHLLVVGDVTAAAVLPVLERAFGGWKDVGQVPAPALPAAAPPQQTRVYLIDRPGAPQSLIRIGSIGAARKTPDYHAVEVANTMLGGSFSSRLNMNLRERNGYTYDAGSAATMRRDPGPFFAGAGVQVDKTVEAVREFISEFAGMAEPPPDEELTRVRNLQALSFPGAFETTAGMAGQLASLVVYDLPDSFFEEFVERIQAVGPADIQRIGRALLSPGRAIIVVVGDLATIEQPIRAAGLGPVTIVAAEDVLK